MKLQVGKIYRYVDKTGDTGSANWEGVRVKVIKRGLYKVIDNATSSLKIDQEVWLSPQFGDDSLYLVPDKEQRFKDLMQMYENLRGQSKD